MGKKKAQFGLLLFGRLSWTGTERQGSMTCQRSRVMDINVKKQKSLERKGGGA